MGSETTHVAPSSTNPPADLSAPQHVDVSRHPELFCSGEGVSFDDIPPEVAEMAGAFLAVVDPRHSHMRGLVTHAFTPRQIRKIGEQIAAQASAIVSDAVAFGELGTVRDVAKRLPLGTISEMLGVGPAERDEMYDGVNVITGTACASTRRSPSSSSPPAARMTRAFPDSNQPTDLLTGGQVDR